MVTPAVLVTFGSLKKLSPLNWDICWNGHLTFFTSSRLASSHLSEISYSQLNISDWGVE